MIVMFVGAACCVWVVGLGSSDLERNNMQCNAIFCIRSRLYQNMGQENSWNTFGLGEGER